jgi:glucose-1-phosphate adenylyltransferase
VSKVAVITQFNSRSLHDHLSSAKWWDLGFKQGGLFVFSPYLTNDNNYWYKGTADSIYQNLTYLKRSKEPYVIIASGNSVYQMDFNDVIAYHERKEADVTIVYKHAPELEDLRQYGILNIDDQDFVTEFEEKPLEPQTQFVSMGIYLMGRILLIKLLEAIHAEGRYDLVEDVFLRYRKRLRIMGYRFEGYWRTLNSIKAYFDCNMDFLRPEIRTLFTRRFPYLKTKPKDEPPAKYNIGAYVTDSLVGSGAILNGYTNRSVLSRKVYTGEHSTINHAIVMEGCYIGNHCVVENAIIDKEAVLSDGKHITGKPNDPIIITKGMVM